MRRIRVGISGPSHDTTRWFDGLDCVELPGTGRGCPTLAEAHAWRTAAPPGFEFMLRATPSAAPKRDRARAPRSRATRSSPVLEDTPAARRAWKATVEIARALRAAVVIIPTPASFRPTTANAARLEGFVGWAHRDGLRLGWEPRNGDWPDAELARLCRESSLTHVVDPLRRRPARGRPPCFRLNGVDGPGHHYTDDELSEIVRRCDDYGDGHAMYDAGSAYCLFGNATRREDARRLRRLLTRPNRRAP